MGRSATKKKNNDVAVYSFNLLITKNSQNSNDYLYNHIAPFLMCCIVVSEDDQIQAETCSSIEE